MANLKETLEDPTKKPKVVDDCGALVDAEVADQGGLSGLAIKAGYAAVKGIKPGFIKHAVTDLLPEFAAALDPIYAAAKAKGAPVESHFLANSGQVADALLAITDGKARHASGLVKGTYERLRPAAKKNVEQAVPRLGRLVSKHTS